MGSNPIFSWIITGEVAQLVEHMYTNNLQTIPIYYKIKNKNKKRELVGSCVTNFLLVIKRQGTTFEYTYRNNICNSRAKSGV